MAKLVTFEVYDAGLNPVDGLVFDFLDPGCYFGTRVGVPRTPPAITGRGDGNYDFQPTDADEAIGCVWVITTGNLPGLVAGAIFTPDAPFIVIPGEYLDGVLETGVLVPTFVYFKNLADAPVTAPTITGLDIGAGAKPVFVFTPTPTDLAEGRKYLVQAIPGQYPNYSEGTIQIGPAVGDFTPPVVTLFTSLSLTPTTPVHLTVTDDVLLARVAMYIKVIASALWEIVHDGDSFGPMYEGSTRTVITDGFDYVLVRRGGWPDGKMRLEIVATDAAGNEA